MTKLTCSWRDIRCIGWTRQGKGVGKGGSKANGDSSNDILLAMQDAFNAYARDNEIIPSPVPSVGGTRVVFEINAR